MEVAAVAEAVAEEAAASEAAVEVAAVLAAVAEVAAASEAVAGVAVASVAALVQGLAGAVQVSDRGGAASSIAGVRSFARAGATITRRERGWPDAFGPPSLAPSNSSAGAGK